MSDYKQDFIQFAVDTQVLRFGEFTLKSGRQSPYFFNSGLFDTGARLAALGRFYAQALVDCKIECDMLFGPAYKGIPLVSSLAIALADKHQQDKPYAFNRKEAKDHGEGGNIVGAELHGKVLIVDDVISAGTSVRESVDIINNAGAQVAGVLIALDRQERGQAEKSAIQEVEQELKIPVRSIIQLQDLITYLENQSEFKQFFHSICAYRDQFGV